MEMTRKQFLANAFKNYNEGKISAKAYDYLLENIDEYIDEDDEADEEVNA